MTHPEERFMREAIAQARASASAGQYALGAVVVRDGEVLAVGNTTLNSSPDPTAHAEVNAIRAACEQVGSRYLEGAWLYSTLEPCPMCASAAVWAKMAGVVFGASGVDADALSRDPSSMFSWRQIDVPASQVLAAGTPRLELHGGFLRDACVALFDLS